MPEITCPCGNQFHARPSDVAEGGGKYCSPACYYSRVRGAAKTQWKGDAVSYAGLHQWVRREKGSPSQCAMCGKTDGRLEWANISREYHRDVSDWMPLCVKCHRRYDCYSKPTCRRGHEWTPENTRIRGPGWRSCRICSTERRRERRAQGKTG